MVTADGEDSRSVQRSLPAISDSSPTGPRMEIAPRVGATRQRGGRNGSGADDHTLLQYRMARSSHLFQGFVSLSTASSVCPWFSPPVPTANEFQKGMKTNLNANHQP